MLKCVLETKESNIDITWSMVFICMYVYLILSWVCVEVVVVIRLAVTPSPVLFYLGLHFLC